MKIKNINLMLFGAAALLSGAVVSCADDDYGIFGEDETPLPTPYPFSFVASVGDMKSRALESNSWTEGDRIGIRLYTPNKKLPYNNPGIYELNTDGSVKEDLSNPSLSWIYKSGDVKAWFPYDFPANSDISDQSEGWQQFNFMRAEATGQQFDKPVNLQFTHQMAKVCIEVEAGEGLTSSEIGETSIKVFGYTNLTFSENEFSHTDRMGWIQACHNIEALTATTSYHEAAVMPCDMSGQKFIQLNVTVNYNGKKILKTFTYTPGAGNGALEAGKQNTYSFTVNKDVIKIKSVKVTDWDDIFTQEKSHPFVFKVKINNAGPDILNKLVYSDNVTPLFDQTRSGDDDYYINVEGNEFSIAIPDGVGEPKKGLPVVRGRTTVNRTLEDGKRIFSYYIKDMNPEVDYDDYVDVGDFLFTDGTWASEPIEGKKCAGIVIYRGLHPTDTLSFYERRMMTKVHGYAVAIRHANLDDFEYFYLSDSEAKRPGNHVIGLLHLKDYPTMQEMNRYNGFMFQKMYEDHRANDDHEAIRGIEFTRTFNDSLRVAGENSGWYIPSVFQLIESIRTPRINELFQKAGGTTFFENDFYYTCTMHINLFVNYMSTRETCAIRPKDLLDLPYVDQDRIFRDYNNLANPSLTNWPSYPTWLRPVITF